MNLTDQLSYKDYINTVDEIHKILNPPSLLEFFEEGFELTEDDRLSKFSLEISPWIKTLCEWYEDPLTVWIYLIQASQTGKTLFEMGFFSYISQYVLGAVPVLWSMAIEEEVKIFINNRLKKFLGKQKSEQILKDWKTKAFQFNNALCKIGYGSTEQTLRSMPCRFIICDEMAMWKVAGKFVKERTRTFKDKRFGIFSTTPPANEKDQSWLEATSGNFYQWWVKCDSCKSRFPLLLKYLKFDGKRKNGTWDLDKVQKTTRLECPHCQKIYYERDKLRLINTGEAVCVDWKTNKKIPEKVDESKTLQISATYSIFTPWSELVVDFLKSKQEGAKSLRVYIQGQLAEVPIEQGEGLKKSKLKKFVNPHRIRGFQPDYDLYTAGVDLQYLGELYCVVLGWKASIVLAPVVLDYWVCPWKDHEGNENWTQFLKLINPYRDYLHLCALDASFGKDAPRVYDFVSYMGTPFMALKEDSRIAIPARFKSLDLDPVTKKPFVGHGVTLMEINSNPFKDEVEVMLDRKVGQPGTIDFPKETEDLFFKHMTNEHRVLEKNRYIWKPKYEKAPQHWFSSFVYAIAASYDRRYLLQIRESSKDLNIDKKTDSKNYEDKTKLVETPVNPWVKPNDNWFRRR